ncbi:LIC11966 family surface protein [Lacibacter sediminis]|uniref:DUF3829 domain-containing protein n=1 Tax=Lacibacter sediminis TaxID=2760713 RepID=A0A7G5XGG6_9BACT|nr:hypothetical protein [Lacibacter sediminis]QNA44569.1 hypothetical protein H4075_21340 [Lacibacter sediminis]
MKAKHLTLFFLIQLFCLVNVTAQPDNPVEYMNMIEKAEEEANQKYLAYISTAAHSGRVKKIERMRQQVLDGIVSSRNKVIGLPIYKSDKTLWQSSIDYLKLLYLVFSEDYAKIVNMEDIAEQSFNEMQAYLLLQEKTSEKLSEANMKRQLATKEFAARNNVQLVDGGTDEFAEKMKKAGDVVEYRNTVYLLFFKCNWQWNELNKAIKTNKVTDIEQARNAVITYAKEGLAVLDTMKNFSGDPSLANACKYALNQFKRMSENDVPKMTDFILKSENFEKVKKSFDSKSQRDRTQQDIDAYNKAVNEMNAAVNTFNSTGKFIGDTQSNIINTYNKADKDFADRHTPYFKK